MSDSLFIGPEKKVGMGAIVRMTDERMQSRRATHFGARVSVAAFAALPLV